MFNFIYVKILSSILALSKPFVGLLMVHERVIVSKLIIFPISFDGASAAEISTLQIKVKIRGNLLTTLWQLL